jgi:hypothetical protein
VSDSLPPYLLRLPGSRPGSAARGRAVPAPAAPPLVPVGTQQQDAPPVQLLGVSGSPGTYQPAGHPLPEGIAELRRSVTPVTPEPWPAGAYVPIGRRGTRRAHWTGTDWKLRESPGYGGELVAVGDRSGSEQMTEGAQA